MYENNNEMFTPKFCSKQNQNASSKSADLSTLLFQGFDISNNFTASYSTVAYLFWPQAGRGTAHFNSKTRTEMEIHLPVTAIGPSCFFFSF